MIFFRLFYQFAKIGIFIFGGGMATIPFLYELGNTTGWFDNAFVTQMISVSESTPGPIGINIATYTGYTIGFEHYGVSGGILGSVIASIGIALPCIIISLLVAKCLARYSNSQVVKDIFYGIRPAVIGLITFALYTLVKTIFINTDLIGTGANIAEIISFPKLIYFGIILFAILKFKKNPIIYIIISAIVGIIFAF